jgi:demethylmenaquinone methyltransferase/2-methoxy-6-polyprenyl-1,4-benzoquinol methylase
LKLKFDHFGILAPFYERFIPPRVPEKILELLRLSGNEIVLDAGGGTGRLAQFLSSRAALIVVADESTLMLREAGTKDGLKPVCSFTEHTPFASDTFDRIMMVDALHHVVNQAKTTADLWRILKPGGRLIIEEPNIHSVRVKFIALAEKLALMRSHFLSGPEIQLLYNQPGAQIQVQTDGPTVWVIVDKS